MNYNSISQNTNPPHHNYEEDYLYLFILLLTVQTDLDDA